MLVLDTDVITIIQHRAGADYERLLARLQGINPETVFATIISFEEQCRGWLAQIARAKSADRQIDAYGRLRELLTDYCSQHVLVFDAQAAANEAR